MPPRPAFPEALRLTGAPAIRRPPRSAPGGSACADTPTLTPMTATSASSFFALILQSWRAFRRDWRAGELRLLTLALMVAVASITSVGFLSDRIGRAMERDAAMLLGGDLVVRADTPIPDAWQQEARAKGLQASHNIQFPSMAFAPGEADGTPQLVAVKAVDASYPLRGSLLIGERAGAPGTAVTRAPEPGTVWIEPQLAQLLQRQVGDSLQLGDALLKISALLLLEPDRGMNFVNLAPRVLLRTEDLDKTGLITVGSRVSYRWLLAGDATAVNGFQQWLERRLERGQRLETLDAGRPELQRTLDRAKQFLSLVALLAALIAAVAVALAARRFTARHLDGVATMRCLGVKQATITRLFMLEFIWIALIAAALGSLIGLFTHWGLLSLLGQLVGQELPAPSWLPAWQGFLAGIWLLLGFALPPLLPLRKVSPVRVLRRDLPVKASGAPLAYAFGALGFAALLVWFANDLRLGTVIAGGFFLGFLLFAAVAALLIRGLQPLRQWQSQRIAVKFALAGLSRRQGATIAQVCALSIGLMALLLLTITQTDLVDGWRKAAPPDAPNRFILNIQPDQRADVAARLQAAQLDAELYPMIRGRLLAINGHAVQLTDYDDDRARRLVDREFNLSYRATLPEHNRIAAGQWFQSSQEVSLETGIAETLGLQLGDVLRYDIAGVQRDFTLTSLRALDWDSMRVNFFALMPPEALDDLPQSFITSFHLPATQAGLPAELVRDYPNLTVVDTSSLLRQVQGLLGQAIAAVQLLFGFTLLAGCLVLYAALLSSRDERIHESALLRALGATQGQLAQAQRIELSLIGALAGLLAALGATAVSMVLASTVFHFSLSPNPLTFVAGIAAGVLCAWLGGWFGLRGVLKQPPLSSLRNV